MGSCHVPHTFLIIDFYPCFVLRDNQPLVGQYAWEMTGEALLHLIKMHIDPQNVEFGTRVNTWSGW